MRFTVGTTLVALLVIIGLARSMAMQKLIRPGATLVLSEKIPQAAMGITLDVNAIAGTDLEIRSGMKGRHLETAPLVHTYKRSYEPKEAGEFEIIIRNGGSEFANLNISAYVDKVHEDTDDAEMLKKLLDRVRVDLMNLYNDNLKLKNSNTQSLVKTKNAKALLWVISICPLVLYAMLNIIRLHIIKGFFSTKPSSKI